MKTLWLRVVAPFAAFRGFQAGVYRTSSPVMPPSTAMGLIFNLAGIEMRAPVTGPITRIRSGLPQLRLAIGTVSQPGISTLYQQLHSYPVGNSGKELAERTYGVKYWIVPVRREVLVDLDVVIGVQTQEPGLLDRVEAGLAGELPEARYGLPFAGDNSYLFDRIDVLEAPLPTRWYTYMGADATARRGSCRLTVAIDREDNSRTVNRLYAPLSEPEIEPPEDAWTWVPECPDNVEVSASGAKP